MLPTCGMAGVTNTVFETVGPNEEIQVTILWTWDQVSVAPNCDGPVSSIHLVNTDTQTWYAHLPKKTAGSTVVAIAPGANQTLTGGQLKSAGLSTYQSVIGVGIDQNPNPE